MVVSFSLSEHVAVAADLEVPSLLQDSRLHTAEHSDWLMVVMLQHARTCKDLHVGDWSRLLVTHYQTSQGRLQGQLLTEDQGYKIANKTFKRISIEPETIYY